MSDQEQGPLTDSDIVSVLPVEARKRQLPSVICRLILGARLVHPWRGRKDIVLVEDIYGVTKLAFPDFDIARGIADRIEKELGLKRVVPAHQILVIRDRAQDILESMTDKRAGKCGIVMLKDQGGCGHWRMVLPSRYMNRDGLYIDITGGSLDFDGLLSYDTIFVQRVHDWESVSVLERLKQAGKRLVYDIDDDLFAIPEDNPASKAMGRNEHMAAVACMKLADVVTTTTEVLQSRLTSLLEGKVSVVVVPNAIDPDTGWLATPMTGSPDGQKRIFWQGSNTHDSDWDECFGTVEKIMRERDNVRLIVLGFLPTKIRESMNEPQWLGRIEYLGPMVPDAYFELIKHVRADVGLAPLRSNWFNAGKSPIKWIENSLIGMPTVASDVEAYSAVIIPGKDGYLCSDESDWKEAIDWCLDNEKGRKGMVANARRKIKREFNIKSVSGIWRNLLIGR